MRQKLYLLMLTVVVITGSTFADLGFNDSRQDANSQYLWNYAENWMGGSVPTAGDAVELGNEAAGVPVHCTVTSDADCSAMELAEAHHTEGSTLWIQQGATMTVHGGLVTLSKDRESWTTVDGNFIHSTGNTTFRVGGPWGDPRGGAPSNGHLTINPTGLVECWFLGINTDHRANDVPSVGWPRDGSSTSNSTDSEIIVNGGRLIARNGIRMSTTQAARPGKLICQGDAYVRTDSDSSYGFDFWCGIIEIHDGNVDIQIDDLEVWGNKYADEINIQGNIPVGWGYSIFKFIGSEISVIRVTGPADFIDGGMVDVSGMIVPDGSYKIIDAESFVNKSLQFTPGTDIGVWSFLFDDANGDLYVVKDSNVGPEPRVSAGPDTGTMLPSTTVSLDGTVFDDGAPGPLTITWSQVSGPAGVTFSAGSSEDTNATLPGVGTYVLRLTADDGQYPIYDELSVTVFGSSRLPQTTYFQMSVADGNGDYLWDDSNNWDVGTPIEIDGAFISGSTSATTVHAVVRADAKSNQLHVSNFSADNTLRVKAGGSLSVYGLCRIGYKNPGHLYIEGGSMRVDDGSYDTMCIGEGDTGSAGSSLHMTGGSLYVKGGLRVGLYYVGAGVEKSADCLAEFTGGMFTSRWIRVGSLDSARPSVLRIGGTANVSMSSSDTEIRDAIFEVVDGNATISLNGLVFTKSNSLLKFSGNGVSTISATAVSFAAGCKIDLSELAVPAGTYTLVTGSSITNGGVSLTPASSAAGWALSVTASMVQAINDGSVPVTYLLTVNNGIGDGSYDPNTLVNIFADAPLAGQLFDAWTGDISYVTDANDPNTIVTMPTAAVTVTATYIADPNIPDTYTLTVNGGIGGGSYEASTAVGVFADAPPTGQLFSVWTGDTSYLADANDANTTVTMPAQGVIITATYADDPTTHELTVISGTGDGFYDPNTVVGIIADSPSIGKLFTQWAGDIANIANINDPNTTITMLADAVVTATYAIDPAYSPLDAGYRGRPCGFDMDRDGVIGENGVDNLVGDGVTTDPDGDGVDEDILYVDANSGSDSTGDGSPDNPYQTIQHALNQCDGPGDGAEDIVAIAGVFHEALTLKQGGVAGYYVRATEDFQFPDNPMMLIGWDKDGDGEYPPYDTDDVAVLDGNWAGDPPFPNRRLAIDNSTYNKSHIEIAHISIRDFGHDDPDKFKWPQGVLRPCRSAQVSHLYLHDIEAEKINEGGHTNGYRHIVYFWLGGGADFQWFAFQNNFINGYSGYGFRGRADAPSGHWLFDQTTYVVRPGIRNYEERESLGTVFKVWGTTNDVRSTNNHVIGCMPLGLFDLSSTGGSGWSVQGMSQDVIIKNNLFDNCRTGVTMNVDSGSEASRPIDNVLIEGNLIVNSHSGADYSISGGGEGLFMGPYGISITGAETNDANGIHNLTIANNMISLGGYNSVGISINGGNDTGSEVTAPITCVGNTVYRATAHKSGTAYLIGYLASVPIKRPNIIFKNNISAANGTLGRNIYVKYAPTGWDASGNVFNPGSKYTWDGSDTAGFAAWQAATGQDANSIEGIPAFLAPDPNGVGDLHLDPFDTVAVGAGVNITSIIDFDLDGDSRSAVPPTAGADVHTTSPDVESPTIVGWHSAADHGRGVGEALLEILDDDSFSESRGDGIGKLIVEFSEAIDPLSFTPASVEMAGMDANGDPVALSGVTIGTSLRNGDAEGEITFSPTLPDYARYAVKVSGVTDPTGNVLAGDADRILTALLGDTSGDLLVNVSDYSAVRGARTNLIVAANASEVRCDVTIDGRVNVADMSRIRPQIGKDATGISDPVAGPIPYMLTVTGGSGGGSYIAGAIVNISANTPPGGQVFDAWTGDTAHLANANDANTIVTMPSANIAVASTYVVPSGGTIELRIINKQDDGEEHADGTMGLTSSDLDITLDGSSSSPQTIGLRFVGLSIPNGATITSAYIQFTADETDSVATTLVVQAEDINDAPTFPYSPAFSISSRDRTTASVAWNPAAWSAGDAGADQQTPDLAALVQEVVDRGGWSSGNAIVFIITGTGQRVAEAYNPDNPDDTRALLHIEFTN